jgi:hypothetical protein
MASRKRKKRPSSLAKTGRIIEITVIVIRILDTLIRLFK